MLHMFYQLQTTGSDYRGHILLSEHFDNDVAEVLMNAYDFCYCCCVQIIIP